MRRLLGAVVPLLVLLAGCHGGPDLVHPPEPVLLPAERPPLTIAPPPPVSAAPATPAVERPNLLVIETDDMRADDLRFMPGVRRLIEARGLRFTHAVVPNAICCPSRSSFLTSQYSHNHGVLSHVDPYGFTALDDSRTIATRLEAAGYRTGLVGKYLNGYGLQPVHDTTVPSLTYVPPGWTDWRAGSDRGVDGGHTYHYSNIALNLGGEIVAHPGRYAEEVLGEHVRDMIGGFEEQPTDPWFVWWTPISPHHGAPGEVDDPEPTLDDRGRSTNWLTPGRDPELIGRFDTTIERAPGVRRDGRPSEADIDDRPGFLRVRPEMNDAERAAAAVVTRQRAEALAGVDREVRRTLRMLERRGLLEETVVVFTSDNGYFLGEHRIRQGKLLPYEPASIVPLVMSGPGIPRGVRRDPVTVMDLAETLVDLAGLPPTPGADGVSVLERVTGGDRGWDRPVVLEALRLGPADPGTRLSITGVRTARWKYLRHDGARTELYDLAADPLELTNLAGRPDHRAIERTMRRLWIERRDCSGQACLAPLPERLRVDPVTLGRWDRQAQRTRAAYYGG